MLSKAASSTIFWVFGTTQPGFEPSGEHSTHNANGTIVNRWVKPQVAPYQRLLKWYLKPPSLTLSNIRYVSRVRWSNPRKGVAPSPSPRCSSYWKGGLVDALDNGRQLTVYLYIYIYMWRERFTFIPERGFTSHVWRRGRLTLDPLWNKSSFRVFLSGI